MEVQRVEVMRSNEDHPSVKIDPCKEKLDS